MLKTNEKYIGVQEYFAREEITECKSEYYCGDVFAMAGGTPNHNRITVNLVSWLNAQFRGRPCEAFATDLRIQIEKGVHYTYPDVVVACGELKLAEGRSDTIVNPTMIIEVLSESTKDYDRGTEFTAYRTMETLLDYMLVDQDAVHIEYFSKENDGTWRLQEYFDIKEAVTVKSVQVAIPISRIYERVVFSPQKAFKSCHE